METLDLFFNGKIVAEKCNRSAVPKKASIHFFDHLNVENWIYTDVAIYVYRTATKTKYFAVVKDNRENAEQRLKDNK